jgi:hypothetical protein
MKLTHKIYERDTLASPIQECHALISDPPYSARTHGGQVVKLRPGIKYPPWGESDVLRALASWSEYVWGWMVIVTDHVLAPTWMQGMADFGRYVFPPLAVIIDGGGVRLRGDGPASWTRWIVVSRPKCEPWSTWGSLPGGYHGPRTDLSWSGGKPLWLMRQLVEHYSRPGDLVIDPCCGAGTTILAAKETHRSGIGYDVDPEAVPRAQARLRQGVLDLPLDLVAI